MGWKMAVAVSDYENEEMLFLGQEWEYSLTTGETSIGRGKESAVKICFLNISRSHCIVTVHPDGRATVRDCSKNGTFLNGRVLPQEEESPLRSGDTLTLGNGGPFTLLFQREE